MDIKFKHRPDAYYKWEWYYSPQGPEMGDLYRWCWATFGHPGSALGADLWDSHGGWIKFRREEDVALFMLRWS
jgi:hypothetical protein